MLLLLLLRLPRLSLAPAPGPGRQVPVTDGVHIPAPSTPSSRQHSRHPDFFLDMAQLGNSATSDTEDCILARAAGSFYFFPPPLMNSPYSFKSYRSSLAETDFTKEVAKEVTETFETTTESSNKPCPKRRRGHPALHLFRFGEKSDLPVAVVALITTVFAALIPVTTMFMISLIFKYYSSFVVGVYSADQFLRKLGVICIGIVLIGLGTTTFTWIQTSLYCILAERQQTRCRAALYRSLLRRSFTWFESQSNLNGELIQINRCFEEYKDAIGDYFAKFTRAIITVFAMIIACFVLCWRLTLLVIGTLPVILVVLFVFGRHIDRWAEEEDSFNSKASSIIDWNLNSYTWVKTVFSQGTEQRKFDRYLANGQHAYSRFVLFSSAASSFMRFLSLMLFVESFWFGAFLIRKNYSTSSSVISSFYGCLTIATTFSSISVLLVVLQKGMVSFRKILSYIDTRDDYEEGNELGYKPGHSVAGDISIDNLFFEYNSRKADGTGLKNVTMSFHPGDMTFIVGQSGSGKSTIASLLLRLYSQTSGTIKFDGYDITGLNKYWIRDQITLVQQFAPLFPGTVKDNIVLDQPFDATKLEECIYLACLTDLVDTLPKGIESAIGGGTNAFQPSGGEAQRIALARAFYRDTQVLILDESISAVDSSRREQLMQNIRNNRIGRTTIIITHELSQIEADDKVYLIKTGKIMEAGTKRSLLGKNGYFCDLQVLSADSPDQKKQKMGSTTRSTSSHDTEKKSQEKGDENDDNVDERDTSSHIGLLPKYLNVFLSRKARFGYLLGLASGALRSTMTPLFSYFISKLISGIVPTGSNRVSSSRYQTRWSLVVTGIALADGISSFISMMLMQPIADRVIERTRSKAFNKMLLQDMNWFQQNAKKELTGLLMNDTRDFREVYGSCISALSSAIVIFIVGLSWGAIIGWKLALVGISFFPIFAVVGVVTSILVKKAEDNYKNCLEYEEKLARDTCDDIKTVICLNLQDYFTTIFDTSLAEVLKAGTKRSTSIAMGISVSPLVISLAQAVLFYYGIKLVVNGEYTLVQTMQVIMMIIFCTAFAGGLLGSAPSFHRGMRVASRINEILSLEDDPNQFRGYLTPDIRVIDRKYTFEFNNVNFCYPMMPSRKILNNMLLQIHRNTITCLVGRSGCGKSTVISLLLRLYTVDTGKVLVSGYDEETIRLSHLRKSIAMVPQRHNFIEGTIRENLLYGNSDASTITGHQIMNVLDKVNLRKFVESLENGLDTRIGGDSTNMLVSGGQAQRLSIARALLRSAKILILDECTSSLDPYNTNLIIKLLTELKRNHSIIAVTHNKEFMEMSDRICMLESGQVVEEGSYDELLRIQGAFAEFIS